MSGPHTIKPELSLFGDLAFLQQPHEDLPLWAFLLSKAPLYGIPALWTCQLPPALFILSNLCHITLSCLLGGYAKATPNNSPLLPSTLQAGKPETHFSVFLAARGAM